MEHLRRTLSLGWRRKKKSDKNLNVESATIDKGTSTKSTEYQEDERAVRAAICAFQVKYLGNVEVEESRGMNLCEQAIQALLNQRSKHVKAVLHISGDSLRVIDRNNKILLVDQTIEKVSFCAHDRHYSKGFAYICRDGTTRRWLCHGFLAQKTTGERLSHAVGCAFQVCHERKQKYQRKSDTNSSDALADRSNVPLESFRALSLKERMIDPQSAIITVPIQSDSVDVPTSEKSVKERPRPKSISQTAVEIFYRPPESKSTVLSSSVNTTSFDLLTSSPFEHDQPASSTKIHLADQMNTCHVADVFDSSIDLQTYPWKDDLSLQSFSSPGLSLSRSVPDEISYIDAWNLSLSAISQDDQSLDPFASPEQCSPTMCQQSPLESL